MSEIKSTGLDRKYKAVSWKKLLAIGIGGISTNLMVTARAKVQIYGAKVLGLDLFTIAIFITIWTIVDVVNEPIIGRISDKTTRFTRRIGKRFFFILIGSVIMVIFMILIYAPIFQLNPGGGLVNPSDALMAVMWIAIMLSLWDFAETTRTSNKKAAFPDLMRDQKTRARRELIRSVTARLIGIALGLILIPLLLSAFNAFDASGNADNPNAFFNMTIIVCLIFLAILPIELYGFWEPTEMREFRADLDEIIERPPFLDVLKRVFSDKNWVAFMVASLMWAMIAAIGSVGIDYVVLDKFGLNIGQAILPQIAYVVAIAIFGIPSYPLVLKHGTKKVFMIGFIVVSVGFFLQMFVANLIMFTVTMFIVGAGCGIFRFAMEVFRHQAIDNSIIKHGTREEGQYNTVNEAVRSVNTIIQVFTFAIIAMVVGYDPALGTANTDAAKFGLLMHVSLFPLIVVLICGIIFWKLSDITKEKAIANKKKLLELGI